MKPRTAWLLIAVSLTAGYFAGKTTSGETSAAAEKPTRSETRGTKTVRPSRTDPFGGPEFSLKSMDDVQALFKKQRGAVANARITLGVEKLSSSELAEVMEMIQQDTREKPGYAEGRYQLMNSVFEKWVLVDPDAALAFANSCKQRSFKSMAISSCFAGLAQADPERAKLELNQLPKGEIRKQAGQAIISSLATRDPAAALDLL